MVCSFFKHAQEIIRQMHLAIVEDKDSEEDEKSESGGTGTLVCQLQNRNYTKHTHHIQRASSPL